VVRRPLKPRLGRGGPVRLQGRWAGGRGREAGGPRGARGTAGPARLREGI